MVRSFLIGALWFFRALPFFLPFNKRYFGRKSRAFPLIQPRKLWPGNADQGNRLTRGHFRFGGRQVDMAESTWYPIEVGGTWLRRLHDFNWLDDLRASSDHRARTTARALTLRWIEDHTRVRPKSWELSTLATRLCQWMAHFEFLSSSADPGLQRQILKSTTQQYAYLSWTLTNQQGGAQLIRCLKALIVVGLCLPGSGRSIAAAMKRLNQALASQLKADGSHIERSPATQMRLLLDLLDIRAAFSLAGSPVPDWLNFAIAKSAEYLRMLQHGDGRLAYFQGAPLLDARLIQEALERADGGQSPAALSGGASGMYRLRAGRSVLIADGGRATAQPGIYGVHASALAFEFSIGQVRLVSNCGTFDLDQDWAFLQRTSAAHSTLVWADRNSAELLESGGVRREPSQILVRQGEGEGFASLHMSHNGYEDVGGGIHYRSLSLRKDGLVLRGEDRLEGAESGVPLVRFHLYPGVQAEITQNRRSVLLRLSARERGWRFETSGAAIQIAESVVADDRGQPQRAQQIILSPAYEGLVPEDRAMRWQFMQEGTQI